MTDQLQFDFLDTVEKKLSKSKLGPIPIDLIYTAGHIGQNAIDEPSYVKTHCCVAVQSGWLYGIQSTGSGGVCATALYNKKHLPQFIDNNFYNYDHELHVAGVAKWNPKYTTVCDVMTPEQCQKARIPYYSLEQILDWAEELSEHAENVIVIPKYDCLDRIPEKFMLGYSVPTSHGSTPLLPELFRGRRVHLLGGSWKKQLSYITQLQKEVVSIDNNYVVRIAKYGRYYDCNGDEKKIEEFLGYNIPNHWSIATMLSVNNIMYQVRSMYGDKS